MSSRRPRVRNMDKLVLNFGDDGVSPDERQFDEALRRWTKQLKEFNYQPGDLFKHFELYHPNREEDLGGILGWWPVCDFVALQHQLQKSLEENRFDFQLNRLGAGPEITKGVLTTAPYLWAARKDIELVGAILLEASLFARMGSSRARYPHDEWPDRQEVMEYRKVIRERLSSSLPEFGGWPRMCTYALPVHGQDWEFYIDSTYSLWRYLAEEHARIYSRYRILKIDFVDRPTERGFQVKK